MAALGVERPRECGCEVSGRFPSEMMRAARASGLRLSSPDLSDKSMPSLLMFHRQPAEEGSLGSSTGARPQNGVARMLERKRQLEEAEPRCETTNDASYYKD